MEKRIAVIFPGVGYHLDKPLLYYSRKLAISKGYEIAEVSYDLSEFKKALKSDGPKVQEAMDFAFAEACQQLKHIKFEEYDRVVFVGKSIGTVIAARYNANFELDADLVLFTPIESTFAFLGPCEAFVFHGSEDPQCDTDMCQQLCEEMSLTCAVIPGANHSLETGDVEEDIKNMSRIMNTVGKLL